MNAIKRKTREKGSLFGKSRKGFLIWSEIDEEDLNGCNGDWNKEGGKMWKGV